MALSRIKSWIANEILTAAELNAEFNNILNNALSLISPLTGNLNANLKQITNLLFETQASTQSAATEGRVYFQTTEDQIHVDDGTNIRHVPTIASVTRGDMIRATASGQWARLALPTTGKFIQSDGTDIAGSAYGLPAAVSASGTILRSDGTNYAGTTATYPTTAARGDILRAAAANVVGGLTVGSASTILTSDGTDPAWSGTPTIATEDSRTNSVARNVTVQATTSGTPAAGIGTGILFNAESQDEAPSNFGALDFVATDVGTGSEDTHLSVKLRVGGAALDEKYQFRSTSGAGFAAIFTHAMTADRTITLPDSDVTVGASSFALVGTDTTERTSTSTSADTALSTITLTSNIATTDGILVIVPFKKTSGAAAGTQLGITLNATVSGPTGGQFSNTSSTDQAENGLMVWIIPPRDTTYMGTHGTGMIMNSQINPAFNPAIISTARPNADITSIIITGDSGSSSVTMGVKNILVYKLSGT